MNLIDAVMEAQLRNVQRLNIIMLCVMLFLVTMTWAGNCSSGEELEIQNLLKKLNKPAVKSIMSPDGDIIDCVHILQQPAFDHPLLKDHKIQLSPEFPPKSRTFEENKISSKSKPIAQLWHKNGRCPEGTVPIRRTTKADILRADSPHQFGKKQPTSIPQPTSSRFQPQLGKPVTKHEYAIGFTDGDKFYGGEVDINTWNPKVESPNEFSSAQIWIYRSTTRDIESIETGWQVYPKLYGDNKTRFFVYWTNNSYQGHGCYNHFCPGFVQTSSVIVPGGSIGSISIYDGPQYGVTVFIWKDLKSNNWWLRIGSQIVGYWPGKLFTTLSDSASRIGWGGQITNEGFNGHHTTTQMGNGHFAERGFFRAAFVKNIHVIDSNHNLIVPIGIRTSASQSNCYSVLKERSGGVAIFFGGPGRNPKCL